MFEKVLKDILFTKMSGSGNDFIIIDNRENLFGDIKLSELVPLICARKTSVGADGLILIQDDPSCDFVWRFFNADGSEVEMCGNGGRCAARFAHMNNIAPPDLSFRTEAGIIRANVNGTRVKLQMPVPEEAALDYSLNLDDMELTVSHINTGVPHVVMVVPDIDDIPVKKLGAGIRFHEKYAPQGTNMNFIRIIDEHNIAVRTYERGVEDETLACGTGSIAAALIASLKKLVKDPVSVHTRSGEILLIHFKPVAGMFSDVYLEGETRVIYNAHLTHEAYDYRLNKQQEDNDV